MFVPLLTHSSRLLAQSQGYGIYADIGDTDLCATGQKSKNEVINCHFWTGKYGQKLLLLPSESTRVIEDYSTLEAVHQLRSQVDSTEGGFAELKELTSSRPQLISMAEISYRVKGNVVTPVVDHVEYIRMGSENLPVDLFVQQYPDDPLVAVIRNLPNFQG